MEKELWDAFYGKESKQERCSVLTETELNKHNKGMLKEAVEIQPDMSDDYYNAYYKDGRRLYDSSEIKNFMKKFPTYELNGHKLDFLLPINMGDLRPFNSNKDETMLLYFPKSKDNVSEKELSEINSELYNTFGNDVYAVIGFDRKYPGIKFIEIRYLDKNNLNTKKKALKEDVDAAPYSTAITNALYTGDLDKEEIASEFINYFSEDELEDVCNILNIEVDDKYINSPSKYGDTLSDMIFNMTINVNALVNEFIQYASDDQCKDILNSLDLLDEFDFLNEGCGKKKKRKALKESAEPVYISVDVARHNGSVIVKSDEFGKITYLPNDFEKLEDTIKRAVNDYAAENNIAEYEVIKLYESKKALKEDYEEDYEEDEELTPVDADSLDVDEFYNGYVMDNAALWDEDIDYDAMEANKNQIFQYWKQLVKGGEDEWDAVEISVRRFASNEELDEGCGKKKKKALKESDDLWSQIQNYKKKYGNPYEESRPTSNGVNDEIKKILNKYNQEYNFLYNNHDKVAGYEEAVRAWDEYINHPDFRELIGKVIKARHDMFTSDREIGALMFALDALGYLDKFDGKESSLEPVVKEFKMNEGKSAKFYKIKCPQFNHLTKINKLAGEGDELPSYYMKHRNDEFYSSKEAKEELKRYKNTSFKTYLTVEEV